MNDKRRSGMIRNDDKGSVDGKALNTASDVMARRRKALRQLAQMELADRIISEDEKILRDLSK
jgi:hypothetical protein